MLESSIVVSEDEKAMLEARCAFLEKYRGVDKSGHKMKMLEQFESDKTCKTWQSCFSKSVTHSQQVTDERKECCKTRPSLGKHFNFSMKFLLNQQKLNKTS